LGNYFPPDAVAGNDGNVFLLAHGWKGSTQVLK
jgi:hypothetical protein